MNPKQLISVISPVTGCKKAGIGLSPLVPSGKLTVRYEKSPSLIGKSTTNVPSSIAMFNYQRVTNLN